MKKMGGEGVHATARLLGGSGGMLPQKMFEREREREGEKKRERELNFTPSEVASGAFSDSFVVLK